VDGASLPKEIYVGTYVPVGSSDMINDAAIKYLFAKKNQITITNCLIVLPTLASLF